MKREFRKYIGNYLLEDQAIGLEDLDRALQKQITLATQGQVLKIGDVLVEMGLITRAQLDSALARQIRDERGA